MVQMHIPFSVACQRDSAFAPDVVTQTWSRRRAQDEQLQLFVGRRFVEDKFVNIRLFDIFEPKFASRIGKTYSSERVLQLGPCARRHNLTCLSCSDCLQRRAWLFLT